MRLTFITPRGEVDLLDGAALSATLIEHERGRIRLCEERPSAVVERYRATAGGEFLPLVRERIRGEAVELEWEWCPEFFAGRFALVIEYEGQPLLERAALIAQTPAAKLHADAYQAMLGDLVRWADGWSRPSPARAAAASATAGLRAELAFLERRWLEIARLVEQLLARPLWALEREEHAAPLHRAHGSATLPTDWLQVPPGTNLSPALQGLATRTRGYLPTHLRETQVTSTLAVPANRFVAGFIAEVYQALPRLKREVQSQARVLPGVARAGAALLTQIERQIGSWRRATWLGEIEPPAGPIEPSARLMLHPVYGALWRLYREWQRPLVLVESGGQSLPLERTYQLYEYWCFLAVAKLLGCQLGDLLAVEGSSVRIALNPSSAHTLPVSPGVNLHFQRTFDWGAAGLQSVSHQVRPDLCLASGERLLILDAKYRVGHDGLREGLGDLHRYRDAIVTAGGSRAVVGGYILIPGAPVQGSDQRLTVPEYWSRWGIGAVVARPGEDLGELAALLAGFVD